MKNKTISWSQLQEKYAGKILALPKDRDKVLAEARDSKCLLKTLKEKEIELSEVILVGPVPKPNMIYVY